MRGSAEAQRTVLRFLCAAFAAPGTKQAEFDAERIAGLDWVEVVAAANRHQIGPPLKSACERRGWWAALPEDVRTYLGLLETGSIRRNEAVRDQAVDLAAVLARAGIPAVLLKSAAPLLEANEPLRLARHFKDLDIAVRERDAAAARGVLAAQGYTPTGDEAAFVGHFHAVPLRQKGQPGAAVELHHHIGWQRHALSTADLLAECGSPAGLPDVRLPSPVHRIAIRCLSAQIQDVGYATGAFSLRDLCELAELGGDRDRPIDWPRLAAWARKCELLPHLSGQLMLMERLLGAPLPPVLADIPAARRFVARALWREGGKRRRSLGLRLTGLAVGLSRWRILYQADGERAPRLKRELVVCAGRIGVLSSVVRARLPRARPADQPG